MARYERVVPRDDVRQEGVLESATYGGTGEPIIRHEVNVELDCQFDQVHMFPDMSIPIGRDPSVEPALL